MIKLLRAIIVIALFSVFFTSVWILGESQHEGMITAKSLPTHTPFCCVEPK